MTATAVEPPTLHFRGGPASLECFVPVARDEIDPRARLSVASLQSARASLTLLAHAAGERMTRLHTSLSRSTPPGTYRGSAELGGKRYPIEIHVDPTVYLSLSPRQLKLSATAGAVVEVDRTLVNSGNVGCVIGKTYAFGLYDMHGADRAVGAVFQQSAKIQESRVEKLLEKLAEGHGGLVRVAVTSGDGPIAPGEVKQLGLELRLPDKLTAGRTYSGVLPLENLRYYIEVAAVDG